MTKQKKIKPKTTHQISATTPPEVKTIDNIIVYF